MTALRDQRRKMREIMAELFVGTLVHSEPDPYFQREGTLDAP